MSKPEDAAALAVFCGERTPEVEAFRVAVEREGIDWTDAGSPAPVVVFMTDPDVIPDEAILCDREVLPVLFMTAHPEVFRGVSKLYPHELGAEVAVSRLADSVRNGVSTLLVWSRLVDEACGWKADGGTAHLLREAQQPAALAALGSERGKTSPHLNLVREFIETSARRTRSVRRRSTTILSTVAFLLITAILIATVQSVAAKAAYDQSTTAANSAEGGRLTDLALGYLDRDPDLPLMLAGTAVEFSDAATVRKVVGQVARTQVVHASYDVDGVPYNLTTSDTGRMAVTVFDDSTIRVYGPDGRLIDLIKTQPDGRDPRTGGAVISPDGTEVAFDDGTLRIFEVGGATRKVASWTGDDTIQRWWDDEHLLVNGPGTADLLDVKTSRREPIAGEGLGHIRVAKPSLDGSVIALSDMKMIQVWDIDKHVLLHEAEVPGITDLALSNDGAYLIGASYPHAQLITFKGEQPEVKPATDDWATIGVESLGEGYFATSDRVGTVALYSSESADTEPLLRFRAHLSDDVRIARIPGGDLASVGFDRKLRVWSTSDIIRLGVPTPAGVVYTDASAPGNVGGSHALDGFPAATLRNQVRIGPTGLANIVVSAKSTAVIVDPGNPADAKGARFGGVLGRLFLSEDGGYLVIAENADDGVLELWPLNNDADDWDRPILKISVNLPLGPGGTTALGPVLTAVAPGASAIALASSSGLMVWDGTGDMITSVEFRATAQPLAISVDEQGDAQAITADGILHSTVAADVDLLAHWPSGSGTVGLAAAEFSATGLYLLSPAGAVVRYKTNTVELIVPEGTLSGLGTLRVADDGHTVLSIAPDALTVLRDGRATARQSTQVGIPVEDAALTHDGSRLISISAIGTVASVELSELGLDPLVTPPREYSNTERLAFGLGGADG